MHESPQARCVTRKLLAPASLHRNVQRNRVRILLDNRLTTKAALVTRGIRRSSHSPVGSLLSNGMRLSCGALKNDSFPNLRAPPASSAC